MNGPFDIRKAADVIFDGRGWCIVDTRDDDAPFIQDVPGWTFGAAKVRAQELNAKPARKRRAPRTRNPSTFGVVDGRDFDNLGDSPDY